MGADGARLLRPSSLLASATADRANRRHSPVHPGAVLEEEYLRPLGLSCSATARAINVPATRIAEIVRGRRAVTADTALRLARFLGTEPELWLGLQVEYDLSLARSQSGGVIQRSIEPWRMR